MQAGEPVRYLIIILEWMLSPLMPFTQYRKEVALAPLSRVSHYEKEGERFGRQWEFACAASEMPEIVGDPVCFPFICSYH